MELIYCSGGNIGISNKKIFAEGKEPYYPPKVSKDKEIKPFNGEIEVKDFLDMHKSLLHILNEDYTNIPYIKEYLGIDNEEVIEALIKNKKGKLEYLLEKDKADNLKKRYSKLRRYYIKTSSKSLDIFVPAGTTSTKTVLFLFKHKNKISLLKLNQILFKSFVSQFRKSIEGSLLLKNEKTDDWASIIRNKEGIFVLDSRGQKSEIKEIEKEMLFNAIQGFFDNGYPYLFKHNGTGIIKDRKDYYIVLNNNKFPMPSIYKLAGLFS